MAGEGRGKYDRELAAARRNSLKDEMSDEPVSYDAPEPGVTITAEDPTPVVAAPPAAPEAVPSPAVSVDAAAALAAILGPLLKEIQAGNHESTKALIQTITESGTRQAKLTMDIAKEQRHSNMLHPDISAYNPFGERDFPRPELEGRVFLAQQRRLDEISHGERQLERLFQYEGGTDGGLTYFETLLLNALPAMDATRFTLVDGDDMNGKTQAEVRIFRTPEGKTEEKLIVCYPFGLIAKKNHMNKNNFPGPLRLARQLLGEKVARTIIGEEIARLTPRLSEVHGEKAALIIAKAIGLLGLAQEDGRLVAA